MMVRVVASAWFKPQSPHNVFEERCMGCCRCLPDRKELDPVGHQGDLGNALFDGENPHLSRRVRRGYEDCLACELAAVRLKGQPPTWIGVNSVDDRTVTHLDEHCKIVLYDASEQRAGECRRILGYVGGFIRDMSDDVAKHHIRDVRNELQRRPRDLKVLEARERLARPDGSEARVRCAPGSIGSNRDEDRAPVRRGDDVDQAAVLARSTVAEMRSALDRDAGVTPGRKTLIQTDAPPGGGSATSVPGRDLETTWSDAESHAKRSRKRSPSSCKG